MTTKTTTIPASFANDSELEAFMIKPYEEVVELMRNLEGDIAILGVAGKMGITLGATAVAATKAAGISRKVYGVSRFSTEDSFKAVADTGMVPLRCDLLDPDSLAQLPQVPNIVFMAGRKFGTTSQEEQTWAANVLMPARVCDHFTSSRMIAFSTGCVYPLVTAEQPAPTEKTPAQPVGEYAQSCLGRERIFEYYAKKNNIPVSIIRLNYSLDLRYGVLHDIAQAIWEGRPVSLEVPVFNGLWQGDANNLVLRTFEAAANPATILNLTGPETLKTREVAEQLGKLLDKPVMFQKEGGELAYLNDSTKLHDLYGKPRISIEQLLLWTADWIRKGGRSYGKPTHFEVSTGTF